MSKKFQITGTCIPEKHYMVHMKSQIQKIVSEYIEEGQYFSINRARQYGKTTTLYLLERYLKKEYLVISLSFEAADELFYSLYIFASGLIRNIGKDLKMQNVSEELLQNWLKPISPEFPFHDLSDRITDLCSNSPRKIILMIDEVDKSSENQIFLSFLGLLREKYLKQQQSKDVTFQSVILAGVYDIKNLKLKLHPGEEAKYNSPWNIAADFNIDMSFSPSDICEMLSEYEADWHTGMDIIYISRLIYDYTSGYPYLVSGICRLIDEAIAAPPDHSGIEPWSREGVAEAVRLMLRQPNTLFDDMIKHLAEYPDLAAVTRNILFHGTEYSFNHYSTALNIGVMFGFLKERRGKTQIANRIFEMHLYQYFLSEELIKTDIQTFPNAHENQFIKDGALNMDLVIKKFVEYYTDLYQEKDESFFEKEGRKMFLLYLRPIINGTGNFYVEAETRDETQTDVIVDYLGKQYVIELKLWRGKKYNEAGEKQLIDYLNLYHLDKGYMLTFSFNKKKQTGIKEITIQGKRILEAFV